jgi:hypothetical protein
MMITQRTKSINGRVDYGSSKFDNNCYCEQNNKPHHIMLSFLGYVCLSWLSGVGCILNAYIKRQQLYLVITYLTSSKVINIPGG